MLTGKAKKDFTKYIKNDETIGELETQRVLHYLSLGKLRAIWCYLVDWFDSVGLFVQILRRFDNSFEYIISRCDKPNFRHFGIKTRPEARSEAIKEANEIYNKADKRVDEKNLYIAKLDKGNSNFMANFAKNSTPLKYRDLKRRIKK